MGKKSPFTQICTDVRKFLQNDLPRIAGKMAVDEFRENFRRQGFRNNGITPWQDVKRRDPQSSWYGFQYKGEKRTKLNFSPAATQRGILIGPGGDLMNSIRVAEQSPERIVIGSDLAYAQVHNEGGTIRVFGKAKRKLPKRQFIGESKELMDELEGVMLGRIDSIVDKVVDNNQ